MLGTGSRTRLPLVKGKTSRDPGIALPRNKKKANDLEEKDVVSAAESVFANERFFRSRRNAKGNLKMHVEEPVLSTEL